MLLSTWVFGGFCGQLGLNMAPTWGPRRVQNRSKIDQKWHHIFDVVFDGFFIDFGRVLGGFWRSCWHSKSIKFEGKSVFNKISKTAISRGLFVETKGSRGPTSSKNQ